MKKTLAILVATAAVIGVAGSAEARGGGGISIGFSSGYGGYSQPAYYAPQPVYYAPPAYYYGPAYYPPYTSSYRINYWNGPGRWHGGNHRGGWGGHHGGWR